MPTPVCPTVRNPVKGIKRENLVEADQCHEIETNLARLNRPIMTKKNSKSFSLSNNVTFYTNFLLHQYFSLFYTKLRNFLKKKVEQKLV